MLRDEIRDAGKHRFEVRRARGFAVQGGEIREERPQANPPALALVDDATLGEAAPGTVRTVRTPSSTTFASSGERAQSQVWPSREQGWGGGEPRSRACAASSRKVAGARVARVREKLREQRSRYFMRRLS